MFVWVFMFSTSDFSNSFIVIFWYLSLLATLKFTKSVTTQVLLLSQLIDYQIVMIN
jgi:hypothetical protein